MKLVLQSGSTFVSNGGLMGAGAGSVNIWSARQYAVEGPGLERVERGAGRERRVVLGCRHTGQPDEQGPRHPAAVFTRGAAGVPNPSMLHYGDLNLIGLLNPLRLVSPKMLQWGQVGTWTNNQQIIWGDTVYDPQGQQMISGATPTPPTTTRLSGVTRC